MAPPAAPARTSSDPRAAVSRREVAAFVAAALAIRVVLLAVDSVPRFFLGDSGAYLHTQLGRGIPVDRSWVYGVAVNALLRVVPSLTGLLAVQSAASVALCAGIGVFCRWLGARPWIAWAAVLAASLDPLLLFHDRAILTDQPAAVALAAAVAFSAVALARAAWPWSVAASLAFLVALAMRPTVSPVMLVVPLVVLALAMARSRRRGDRGVSPRRRLAAAVVLLVTAAAGYGSYAIVTGRLTGWRRPSVLPGSGYFLLGVAAPILAPEDFAGLDVPGVDRMLDETQHARRDLRVHQIFAPDGLVQRMQAALGGDWRKVSRVGSRAARRAALRDPLGAAALAVANARDYLSPAEYAVPFDALFGLDRDLDEATVHLLRTRVRDEVSLDMPRRPSPLVRWARVTIWTLPVLAALALVLPAIALAATRKMDDAPRTVARVTAVAAWVYVGTVFTFSAQMIPRYLLPLSPMLLVLGALVAERVVAKAPWRALVPFRTRDVFVVFLEFTPEHRESGLEVLRRFVSRMFPRNRIHWLVVDNAYRDDGEVPPTAGTIAIAGDDSSREFSGFDKGIAHVRRLHRPGARSIFVLANDTFHRSYGTDYLRSFDARKVTRALRAGEVVGYVDCYPNEIEVLGLPVRCWIRTSLVLCERRALDALGPLAIPIPDERIFGDADRFFVEDAPLSDNYRRYLRAWLFGEGSEEFSERWHRAGRLTQETASEFQAKARSILCEHYLSARLRARNIRLHRVN